LAFLLLIWVAISLVFKSRDNKKIKEKNALIENQNEILEEKNAEITASIEYAKRIQTAILPPSRLVREYLNNSLIVYLPKDIVAGDFYWMDRIGDSTIYAVADCTGHGVPGAMVSVVCHNAMNRAVREFNLTSPGAILDKTTDLVLEQFEKSEEEVKDGMDIALCKLNESSVEYAGANNPLWIVRGEEIIEIKADKQPVGKFHKRTNFTTHKIDLLKGDTIYIFSDGYVDQFGGENGKKFKAKAMRSLLLSIQNLSMEEQREKIITTFNDWKADFEQVDDVCLIGVRIA
jgi:serine phosphatase RsbU (regulator of sigma subunit)